MRSDMLGAMSLRGSVSFWGSYRRLPDRISWSSCWRANLIWSLVMVRSVCRSTPRCTWTSALRKMTDTIVSIDMLTVSSTRVMPSSDRRRRRLRCLCTAGGGLVGALGLDRAEIDLHGQAGDRREWQQGVAVLEGVGDRSHEGRLGEGRSLSVSARWHASAGIAGWRLDLGSSDTQVGGDVDREEVGIDQLLSVNRGDDDGGPGHDGEWRIPQPVVVGDRALHGGGRSSRADAGLGRG